MIIAGDDQHAAMRRRAISVAVLERIAGAVDARAFAIPEAENALHRPVRIGLDLLRAEDGSGGQVLVDRRQEFDAVLLQEIAGAPEFEVDAAERGAAIA